MTVSGIDSRPHSIELSPILLSGYKLKSVDISGLIIDFNSYSDMFNPFKTLNISISDAMSLKTKMPLIGDETIEFSFRTPGEKNWIDIKMTVFSVEGPIRLKDNQAGYILKCGSNTMFADSQLPLHGRIGPATISELVNSIHDKLVKNGYTNKPLITSKSDGIRDFILTGNGPIKTINFLASEARSLSSKSSTFLYFEGIDSFHFKTIEELSSQDPIETYRYALQNFSGSGNRSDIITDIKTARSFDKLKAMMSGYLGCNTMFVDPLLKTYGSKSYNYGTNFSDNKRPVQDNREGFPVLAMTDKNFGNIDKLLLSTKTRNNSSYIMGRDRQYVRDRDEFSSMETSIFSQYNNTIKYTVTVPGWSKLDIGKTVNLLLPEISGNFDAINKTDELYSGKYLITASNHSLNARKEYYSTFECVKASYEGSVV